MCTKPGQHLLNRPRSRTVVVGGVVYDYMHHVQHSRFLVVYACSTTSNSPPTIVLPLPLSLPLPLPPERPPATLSAIATRSCSNQADQSLATSESAPALLDDINYIAAGDRGRAWHGPPAGT